MKELFFILAFIWILTSVGSLVLGSFIGLNRVKLRRQLVDYWSATSPSGLTQFARQAALIFSWAGFLFPVIFPLPGFIAALLFALLT